MNYMQEFDNLITFNMTHINMWQFLQFSSKFQKHVY